MTHPDDPAHLETPDAELTIYDEATVRAAYELLRPYFEKYDLELPDLITTSNSDTEPTTEPPSDSPENPGRPSKLTDDALADVLDWRANGDTFEEIKTRLADEHGIDMTRGGLYQVCDREGVTPDTEEAETHPDGVPVIETSYALDHENPFHLQWAYEQADGQIGRASEFFDVSKTTVRDNLAAAGIHEPDEVDGPAEYRDPDTLQMVFEEKGGEIAAVADYFGVTGRTIRNWLNRHDIDTDPPWHDPDTLREVFEENDGVVEWTADEFGASPSTIRRWLRRFDILDGESPPGDDDAIHPDLVEVDGELKVEGDTGLEDPYWCGYCGHGPTTSHGIRVHTGHSHSDQSPIWLDHQPEDSELFDGETSEESSEDGGEPVESDSERDGRSELEEEFTEKIAGGNGDEPEAKYAIEPPDVDLSDYGDWEITSADVVVALTGISTPDEFYDNLGIDEAEGRELLEALQLYRELAKGGEQIRRDDASKIVTEVIE